MKVQVWKNLGRRGIYHIQDTAEKHTSFMFVKDSKGEVYCIETEITYRDLDSFVKWYIDYCKGCNHDFS